MIQKDQLFYNNLTEINTDDISEEKERVDYLFKKSALMQREIDFIKDQIDRIKSEGKLYA